MTDQERLQANNEIIENIQRTLANKMLNFVTPEDLESAISNKADKDEIPKYGNDIKLAEDNDGGLTDAVINTNRRIDELNTAKADKTEVNNVMAELNSVRAEHKIDELWNGSIVGGNSINVDLSDYEFGIVIMELYGVYAVSGIITKTSKPQFCWALNDKTTDNGVVSVRYAFTYNSTSKTMSVGTAFFPQIGAMVVENHVSFKLIQIMGVK